MGWRALHILLFAVTIALQARGSGTLGYTKEKPLLFGIDIDYAPMEYVDDKGKPYGFDVEFTRRLMKRLNIPFTYSTNSWEAIAGDVLNGKVDLGMMVYSPYRKDLTNYSQAVFRLYYQIVYRTSDKGRYGLRDVGGKTIAMMKSRPIIDTLQKVGATPHLVSNLSSALRELSDGKYDAVICYRYQAQYLIETLGLGNLTAVDLALMPREYCYVSHNKQLIDSINKALDAMEAEGEIEDVYGDIKTAFGGLSIPNWVWYVFGLLVIAGLLAIIFLQRRSRALLKKEMERARKSEELKDIFLSNLSHSLRTPLNAIIGFSDLLLTLPKGEMSEEEQNNLLNLINANGLQLLHLIDELLSLSDIEGKSQLFDRQEADVEAEMAAYATDVRPLLRKGVELEVIHPVGGMRAMLDKNLMRLVTMHLLDNACRHTTEGKVTLTYYVKNGGLYVEVKDTGCGLPDSLKENIFALLSDKNTYVQKETPGLGLSICKAVIDRSNGDIGARDNEADGRGTIVWFWSPVKVLS